MQHLALVQAASVSAPTLADFPIEHPHSLGSVLPMLNPESTEEVGVSPRLHGPLGDARFCDVGRHRSFRRGSGPPGGARPAFPSVAGLPRPRGHLQSVSPPRRSRTNFRRERSIKTQ
ncbi:unnamed protein product [Prorocentrum cordatum]|uniref:Uncharacterized protein n=1 Tax=Prorocentrum cordatum TaxID=2364126 RepID=A0ABN9PJ11_9DINO|nr:unnamed protein product [Polarella glacialis]